MRFRYFFSWLALILMVGCSTPAALPAPTAAAPQAANPTTAGAQQPYPAPEINTREPGYPAPVAETPTPMPPTAAAFGSVKGELYLQGKPMNKVLLFLSDIHKDDHGEERLVSIDYNTKIRAETQADGSFLFVNVPPKRYALVLVVMPNSFLLLNPKDQAAMVVPVDAGQATNMGRLDYDALPIASE